MSGVPRPRALLVGSLPRPDQPVGGTVVSFAELIAALRERGRLDIDVIDTSRPAKAGRWSELRAASRMLVALARRARAADVIMLNVSSQATLRAGPLAWLVARAVHRPLVLRVFGGSFDLAFERATPWKRWLAAHSILRSELVLLQTRALCDAMASRARVRWLPTSRRAIGAKERTPRACRRFLMLTQLRPEKGIREAIAAIESAPVGCTLDLFGPRMPDTDLAWFAGRSRVRYGGELDHAAVARTLDEHDALLLPSYHTGEGLPGSIVEALQAGLPVIASRWRSLPELVQHEENGLLVEPRSSEDLAKAIARIATDGALYERLCRGAAKSSAEFDADRWTAEVERWLLDLTASATPALEAPAAPEEVPGRS